MMRLVRHRPSLRLVTLAACVVAAGSALTTAAGCSKTDGTNEHACSGAQALTVERFRGETLPVKTLAFTFDDGPGVRTLELSTYLKEEGIPSAFFVNGQMLQGGADVLKFLVADGHVVANHTQTHADLLTLSPEQIVAEVTATDALIAPYVPSGRFLFRPPFGNYDEATFAALEASPMKKYIGPIDWDLGYTMSDSQAADWDCWSPNGISVPPVLTVEQCGDLYLREIRAQRKGIVLFHDPYFIDDDPEKGGTVDMVKYIVPKLKADGFTFVRLDFVPKIAAALPPLPPADAGSDASSGGTKPGSSSGGIDDGGSPDPCPPSPQVSAAIVR